MIVGGVVLAGGRSTRMRTPKADLDWRGEPLVVHVTRTLAAALGPDAPVVVVAAPGQLLPGLPAGVRVARDGAEGRGPLEGLAAGLDALAGHAAAAVVVATDQPGVAAVVSRLLAAREPGDDAVAFRGEPLGALYAVSLAARARARLADGDGSLRGLLASVATRVLTATPDDAAVLRSLDTPEAYEAARP